MATSVIIFLPLILCISGIVGEPQCSPFHYHEQLLERMIDVKYKMDALTNKMDKWETVISEKLEEFGKLVGQSKEELERRLTTEMENQQSSLKVKAEEMEARITTEMENQQSSLKVKAEEMEARITTEMENQQSSLNVKAEEMEARITTEMGNQQSSLNVKAEEMEARITTEMENQQSSLNVKAEKMEARITTEMGNQQSSLKVKAEEMEARITTEITTEIEIQHSYLNRTLTDFSETWKQTIGNQKTPPVLFKARTVKNRDPTAGETVIFQTIVQNEGNGYNADTGIFTVPVTGTYLFTVQLCLYLNKQLSFNIIADGKVVTAANFGDYNWNRICTSTDGLAALNQGAEVKVQITLAYSGNVIYPDNNTRSWSYFSGTILHK